MSFKNADKMSYKYSVVLIFYPLNILFFICNILYIADTKTLGTLYVTQVIKI